MIKTQTTKRILQLLSPIDTAKWLWMKIKKHKILILIASVVAIFQTAYCVNLDPVAKFFTNGTLLTDTITSELRVDLSDPDIFLYLQAVYDVLVPIGQALAVLIWMIGLMELSMRDDLTADLIVKDFLKMILTLIVIEKYGLDIITFVTDLSNEILDLIEGSVPTGITAVNGSSGAFSNVPLGKLGTAFLAIGLLVVLKVIINISVAVTVWLRKYKLMLYAAASPLGLFDFREGFHSTAANFVKKYFAVCLQGALIVIVNAIASGLIATIIGPSISVGSSVFDSITMFIKVAPICLVICTFMKSTEQIACDLLGAH